MKKIRLVYVDGPISTFRMFPISSLDSVCSLDSDREDIWFTQFVQPFHGRSEYRSIFTNRDNYNQ